MPVAAALSYAFTTPHDVHWWAVKSRMDGFSFIAFMGLLVAPWIAMSALYRQISGQARSQALAFELERSQYERKALDARLRLLQAQVEPHFLFNTLANVRELVDSGSPQASERARQPDRLPARGGAAPARTRRHAWRRNWSWCARTWR